MHILKTNFHNNSNVGLFGFATDTYCILPKNLPSTSIKQIQEALNVPIYQTTIHNTNLIGVFCVGNEEFLFVPELIQEDELETLKKIPNVKVLILPTNLTALGNNILINKKNCLVNPNLEEKAIIKLKKYGFKVKKLEIAESSTIGSCAIITNKGCLVHRDADNTKQIEAFFKVKTDIGTVNMGTPYIKSGIIANFNGFITGKDTSGPEIQRIDETLGFL
ncbi:MAG: translation initiation factor IF-6 [Nanoarchaeota archaeon]|jgi:translation initiation factor 6|nr:translation initiation factor IF-6 [Nanoarchaeota archaeon]|tara:strand:- start:18088 stop:18747 length:660 start_codon:yes stop_codon:yes gene_type:complete